MKLAAPLALLALALTCGAPRPVHAADNDSSVHRTGAGTVMGSGQPQAEKRSIGSFQAITLRGPMTVTLRQTGREALELRADDNILPLIETRVVDVAGVPTLEIGSREGVSFSTRDDILVTVDLATLNALAIRGSGDVIADGLKVRGLKLSVTGSGDVKLRRLSADGVSLKIHGSGNVTLDGRANKLGISIAGSGDFEGKGLETDDVSVSIAGSGDASVNARKTLAVSIAGSGDVVYVGDALLKSSIAGHGSVTKH